MKKFSKAKVGDFVWCDRFGEGRIFDIDSNRNTYQISVKFETKSDEETFTLEGFFNEFDIYPSLYWNVQPFDRKNDVKPKVIDWNKVPQNTRVLIWDFDMVKTSYYFFGYLPKSDYPFYACEIEVSKSSCVESFENCEIHPEEVCKEEWYK